MRAQLLRWLNHRLIVAAGVALIPCVGYGTGAQLPFVQEGPSSAPDAETLTIFADQFGGPLAVRHGFIHGLQNADTLSDSMVAFLKPSNWRLYKLESYAEAVAHGARITVGPNNHYAWYKGGYPYAEPWTDWAEFEAYLAYVLEVYQQTFPDNPPDFYDLWSEPDHSYYWHGTYEQLVETMARTINVIKAFNPDAKVVGPSISWYRPDGEGEENIIELLKDLDTLYGLRLDAISWHENGGFPSYGPGRPEDIYFDTENIRAEVEAYFPPSYTPEYHINEFAGGRVHLSPGWTVGYLFWIDYMDIDWASRACWGVLSGDPPNQDYFSDCWAGLNGMFLRDGITPQPTYWVHRAYAEMEGQERLTIWSTDANTLGLATRDLTTNTIRLLAGRYADSLVADVTVDIEALPALYDRARVSLSLIPNSPLFYSDPPVTMAWPSGPVLQSDLLYPVDSTGLSFVVADFAEGESYVVDVAPLLCGDFNADLVLTVADVIYLVNYVFKSGPPPEPAAAGDVSCDGVTAVSDVLRIVQFIFRGGTRPCDNNGDTSPDC